MKAIGLVIEQDDRYTDISCFGTYNKARNWADTRKKALLKTGKWSLISTDTDKWPQITEYFDDGKEQISITVMEKLLN